MTHAEIITELADLRRRLASVVLFGTIAAADYTAATVRVKLGAITTDWLPWLTARAGGDTVWHAPEVGEQVMLISPSGDIGNGVVMPAIYSDAKPANAAAATVHRTTYADGAVVEYDRAAHEFKITTPGKVTINAAGNVTATVGGNLAAAVTGTVGINSTGAISLTSAASITLAGTSIALNAPAVTAQGTIVSQGDITNNAGALGSLGTLQTKYNAHKHGSSPTTDKPVP